MERLKNLHDDPFTEYLNEIRGAVQQLHHLGVVHYDLSPSNLMLNEQGKATIIDFGRAGRIGDQIPLDKQIGVKPQSNRTYSTASDFDWLEKLRGKICFIEIFFAY